MSPGVTPAGALFGRDDDLAKIRARLDDGERLLTLVGPGGVGKTRLARAIVTMVRPPGSARFLECDVAETPADLVRTIARALDLALTEPSPAALVEAMSALPDSPSLIVLDNLEQVTGAGPVVAAVLDGLAGGAVVATSRIPLAIAGERIRVVRPLAVASGPGGDGPAVELFVARATQAWSGFRATEVTLATIREICERLDGLPLAIELAAARSAVLAPTAMLTRIDRSLTVIDNTVPDLPARQRSLRATVEWSYELLSADERGRFRHLAVFDGPFDLAAAAAVLGVPGDTAVVGGWLDDLARQSLLVRRGGMDAGRYVMLQTIQEHARGLLAGDAAAGEVAERHGMYFSELVDRIDRVSREDAAGEWLERLDAVLPDLRGALRHARQRGDLPGALQLAVNLWRYWGQRGLLAEGTVALGSMLDGIQPGDVPDELLGRALNYYANLMFDQGDLARAARYYAESLEVRRAVGEPEAIADTLNNFGLVAAATGDWERARELFTEILGQRRAAGQRYGEALALGNLGDVLTATGDGAGAVALHERCLAIREEIGDAIGIGFALSNLSEALLQAGDITAAKQANRRADHEFHRLGVAGGEALTARVAGDIARARGDHPGAVTRYLDSVERNARIGDFGALADALERLAVLLLATGPDRDAAVLYGCAERMREETGLARWPIEAARHDETVFGAIAALGQTGWASARAEGRVMALEQMLTLASRRVEAVESDSSSPTIAAPVVQSAGGGSEPVAGAHPSLVGLTPRERDVLALVADGRTSADIAERLFISPTTVSAHLRRIYRRLGVSNRTAAASRWLGRDAGGDAG